jgi:hypothetical protein
MDTLLYFCDLRGPPKPSLRTPRGSMDPRLRTYALEVSNSVSLRQACQTGSPRAACGPLACFVRPE